MWRRVLISMGLAASMTLEVRAIPANRNARMQGEGPLSVNRLSKNRQVKLHVVENNTGYTMGWVTGVIFATGAEFSLPQHAYSVGQLLHWSGG
jgi:hypothetical protein